MFVAFARIGEGGTKKRERQQERMTLFNLNYPEVPVILESFARFSQNLSAINTR